MIHFPRKTGGLFNNDEIGVFYCCFFIVDSDAICIYVNVNSLNVISNFAPKCNIKVTLTISWSLKQLKKSNDTCD